MTQEAVITWKSKILHGSHTYDLETSDVDQISLNASLKSGKLFPETTGFMTIMQDQVISTNNYKEHILKNPNITNNICRKCQQKLETIQHITGTCSALAKGDYTPCHNQVATTVH
jgi:hypothetical protein